MSIVGDVRDTLEPRDTLDTCDMGCVFVPELENEEVVEPPRALPDTSAGDTLEDNIYNKNASCGLTCGVGECLVTEADDVQ